MAYFKIDVKCDFINSNMVENVNGFVIGATFKVISMLEEIYDFVMKRLFSKVAQKLTPTNLPYDAY